MAIDVSDFGLDGQDKMVIDAIVESLRSPVSFKIRNGNVCIRGGAKIPTKDITRFKVHRDPDTWKVGQVVPTWAKKELQYEEYNEVNLLPLIAIGLPICAAVSNTIQFTDVSSVDITLYSDRAMSMEVATDYDLLNEMAPLYENMLINVTDLSLPETIDFAHECLISILNGPDICAEALMNVLNQENFISTIWIHMGAVLQSNSGKLGRLPTMISYEGKKGGKIFHVTATERAAIACTCLWVMHMLDMAGQLENMETSTTEIRQIYEQQFLAALGDDAVGDFITKGKLSRSSQKVKLGTHDEITRKQRDNQILFNDIYKVRCSYKDVRDMSVYSWPRIKELIQRYEYRSKIQERLERSEELLDKADGKMKSNNDTIMKLTMERDLLRDENKKYSEQIEQLKRDYEYSLVTKTDRIKQLEEELAVLQSEAFSYYSDDVTIGDESTSEVPIEECVSNINQYNILVIGGEIQLLDKLSSYGVTSIKQYQDSAQFPQNTDIDFFCIHTRFVAHKIVHFIQSHFDTNGRMFYYNGTNIEKFIRSANDFINNWFEE